MAIGDLEWTGGASGASYAYFRCDVVEAGHQGMTPAPGPNWGLERVLAKVSFTNYLTGTTGAPPRDWFAQQNLHGLVWWDPTGLGTNLAQFPDSELPGNTLHVMSMEFDYSVVEIVTGNPNFSIVQWTHTPTIMESIAKRAGNPLDSGIVPAVFFNASNTPSDVGSGSFVCCASPVSHTFCSAMGGVPTYNTYCDVFIRALWRQDS